MTHKTKLVTSLLTAFACLLALPALAADLGSVAIGDSTVTFTAEKRSSLRVTGPEDFTYTADLKTGESYDFPIFSDEWTLADGLYNYELSFVATRAKAQARDRVRGLEQKATGGELRQSGTFRIAGGYLVDPQAQEEVVPMDEKGLAIDHKAQTFVTDVIVQGSQCVGMDCSSSESFGFDTIRLKENNLRIKFDDTSSSGSFPNNDWQLTANDSSNGGANKFSIDDISNGKTPFTVEAGAPSHSLYVDDAGSIGVGTSTPVPGIEVHVKDGDSPTLRLEQDGSSGFTAQTWDVAGNEANFFVRDVTHGSKLPFRIQPGSGNDNALYIASDGDVGLGTTSPGAEMHVKDTTDDAQVKITGNGGYTGLILENTGATAADSWVVSHGNGGAFAIDDTDAVDGAGGSQEFRIFNTGNVTISGTLTEGSSVHGKENFLVVDPEEVLRQVLGLPITTWNYKADDPAVRHMGPMAQEFFAVFGLGDTDTGLAPRNLSAVAIAAIQGLRQEKDQQIEDLQQRLTALEELLAANR